MYVHAQTDKSKSLGYGLSSPHYSDNRFRHQQTVFLAPGYKTFEQYGAEMVKDVSYDYSDRLYEWHHGEKYDNAWENAQNKGLAKDSPALFEAFLQELFEDPGLQLVHLVTGVNHSNGYPYRVYGYIRSK